MIIATTGQKGGSGKSTVALCCASEWHARGRRVLLVDADPQGTSRKWAEVATQAGRSIPTVVGMGAGMHRPDQLPALSASYDVTVVDCPPRLDDIQRSAFLVADLVLLPCGPSALESWALPATFEYLERARMIRPALSAAIVVTRKVPRTGLGQQARESLSQFGVPVLRTELGHRVAYQQALGEGQGPTAFQPAGPAAAEVRSLVGEIETLIGRRNQHLAA